MHIALNGWFWDRPAVGSGQYLRRLLHHMQRIAPDVQFTLVLPPHNHTPDDVPENVNLLVTEGPGGRWGKVWFEQRIFPRMVEQCGADIAHVPYWGPPLSSPAKLVTTILDVAPLVMPEYQAGLMGRLYTALVRAAASGSAHAITISDAARADIIADLNMPPETITTTYLGVDPVYHPRLVAERDEAVRLKYNLPERFVLYLGGFDVRKQVNLLLHAYSYVIQSEGDEVPLVLAGKEPPWGTSVFPDMRRLAGELDLNDYILWPGYIDEEDKPSLYRLATVFVSPSAYEGFGLPVIEAMASGTPVVANEIDVYQETVGDGAFLTNTPRAMAGAIIALLLQEPLRQSMINQGLAQATRFNWRKTAEGTLRVYEQVLRQ
jgi:glycosyltransferase involved in cell wall biosynthesis